MISKKKNDTGSCRLFVVAVVVAVIYFRERCSVIARLLNNQDQEKFDRRKYESLIYINCFFAFFLC